jgi:serine/threonine protein kinase/formylglycine-generating enzyme required for sulfatase activity
MPILEILLADLQQCTAARLADRLQEFLFVLPLLASQFHSKQAQQASGSPQPQSATSQPQATPPTDDNNDKTIVESTAGDSEDQLRTEVTPREQQPTTDEATLAVEYSKHPNASADDDIRTILHDAHSPSAQAASTAPLLQNRYRLDRLLGEGAFGRVYLALDLQLQRQVAIKLPNRKQFRSAADVDVYLTEARMAAALTHPGIVPVYDVGTTPEGAVYAVSRFINGATLETLLRNGRIPERDTVLLLSRVARALEAAHQQHIVHRDIKPANILIEAATQLPFVADFGLAIRSDQQLKQGSVAGTPAYMSPEQALGEAHRLDGRSDVFSLGVILYEMLTDHRPFRGSSVRETLSQVISASPRPLRDFSSRIPGELERICLKALARRAVDRYQSAADLATELENWLDETNRERRTAQTPDPSDGLPIIPRGLRAFSEEDAAFFLQLLPGPRNRAGLPESLAFWKQKLEERNPQKTFATGVIYGPSGCGKSSLIRAGLLPALAGGVHTVFIEASTHNTEGQLLQALKPLARNLPPDADAADACAAIRQQTRGKIVIILDQLEQWLSRNPPEPESILVRALRQCDGSHLQALLLVRDDFSVAVARLMNAIEVPMLEGFNTALVDLFDVPHARSVLARFGQAWNRLPSSAANWTSEQQHFLSHATEALAIDGRIIAVRLTLFAEMLHHRDWTPQTLANLGGLEGLGIEFLEETFHSSSASPQRRLHATAAREILKLLLPPAGLSIRGRSRSRSELLHATGYQQRPADFQTVLQILDSDLKLITPVESADSEPAWQLSHDYLVQSIRSWIHRKQRETRRGRAEILLAELAALWGHRREPRHLPHLPDWLRISLLTQPQNRSPVERQMLTAASRRHLTRISTAFAVILIAASLLFLANRRQLSREMQLQAVALADIRGTAIPLAIDQLVARNYPAREFREKLRDQLQRESSDERRFAVAAALARFNEPNLNWLVQQVENPSVPSSAVLANVVGLSQQTHSSINRELLASNSPQQLPRHCRLSILAFQLGNPQPASSLTLATTPQLLHSRAEFIEQAAIWGEFNASDAARAQSAAMTGLTSALCLALGSQNPSQLPVSARQAWLQQAQTWLLPDSPPALRSAAGWLIRRWNSHSNTSQIPQHQAATPGLSPNLIPLPAGRFQRDARDSDSGTAELVLIEHPYKLAATEVSLAEFLLFINDPSTPNQLKPADWNLTDQLDPQNTSNPVQKVSWNDAVLYCNWLSKRDSLQPCYIPTQNPTSADPITSAWKFDPTASGYRLPFEAEWEWAARCTIASESIPTPPPHLLDRYARFSSTAPAPCGTRLPDPLGFHDLLGNVAEWCQDTDPGDENQRTHRGGSYLTGPADLTARGLRFAPADERSDLIGFRIAQSVTPATAAALPPAASIHPPAPPAESQPR